MSASKSSSFLSIGSPFLFMLGLADLCIFWSKNAFSLGRFGAAREIPMEDFDCGWANGCLWLEVCYLIRRVSVGVVLLFDELAAHYYINA